MGGPKGDPYEPSVSICVGPVLCVGPPRSLFPAPAVSVLGPDALYVGARCSPGALCVRARCFALCVTCVAPRHSPAALCVAPRRLSLSVSGPTTFLRFVLGPACSSDPRVRGPPAQIRMSLVWSAVGPRAHPPVRMPPIRSVPGPPFQQITHSPTPAPIRPALCVGPRRSLWGPALCVRARRSLCPGALCRSRRRGRAALSQDFLCQVPAVCFSGPGALCVGARRSVCRAPALFVSGPGALCVGARRSFCRAPALSLMIRGASQSSTTLSGPAVSVSELGALQRSLCRGPESRRSLSRSASVPNTFASGPGALYGLCVEAQRSVCRGPALFVSGLSAV